METRRGDISREAAEAAPWAAVGSVPGCCCWLAALRRLWCVLRDFWLRNARLIQFFSRFLPVRLLKINYMSCELLAFLFELSRELNSYARSEFILKFREAKSSASGVADGPQTPRCGAAPTIGGPPLTLKKYLKTKQSP